MEKISHSLLKRSFSSNPNAAFTSHKSVYDDVFGGPSKFGLPTLSPRLEDYSEIFGGFHASRSSSIPVLDLSLIDHESDLHFDVRSPGFDYTIVFGDFGGSDFTASVEDLVGQSSGGGYESSDEPWSPAHSGSLSDELDPLAGSDKSHELSDDNVHETLQSIKQFNASYNKSSQRSMKTVLAATSHVTNFSAVPGYTFSHYESPVSWDGEDENCSLGVIDDINHNEESGERVREKNRYESSSNPLHNGFDAQRYDCDPFEKHGNSTSPQDKPFVTVSDISLRTMPSRLPPPSRPPPSLVIKNGRCDKSNSKLNASRSCPFERMADDSAQLFFDVEIDATISAKVTENGNNNVNVKRQSTKESIERKYIRSHSTTQVVEKTDKIVRVCSAIEDEKLLQSLGKGTTVLEPVIEDSIESTESSEVNSGPLGVQYCNHNAEDSAGTVAWDETTGYFEVLEKNISRQAFDIVEDSDTLMQQMNQDVLNHQGEREHDIFKREEEFKEFKVSKEAHRWVEERNQPQLNKEHYDCGNMQQQKIPNTRLSDQKGSPKTLLRSKLACTYDINKMPENFQLLGECQKQEINHSEEVQPEAKGNVNEVEAKLKLKESPERMNVEKGFLDPQITEQNNGKHKQNILREEFQRRLEDMEGAETIREITRERTEAKGTEKQRSGVCGKQNENKLEETYELKESDLILNVFGHDKSGDGHLASEKDMEAVRLIENEFTFGDALKQISNDKDHKLIHKRDVIKERNRDASITGDNFLRCGVAETEAGNKEKAFETKGNMSLRRDAGSLEQLSGHVEELEPIERIWHERGVERDLDSDVLIEGDQLKAFEGGYRVDEVIAANVLGKHDDVQMLEATQAAFSSEENVELKTEPESSTYESETDTPATGRYNESSKNKDELQDINIYSVRDITVKSHSLPKQMSDSSICGSDMGISCLMRDKISSALEYSHEPVKEMCSDDDGVQKMNTAQFASKRIDIMDNLNSDQVIRESVITGRKVADPSSLLKHNDDTPFSKKNAASQWTERKNIVKDNLAAKDQKVEGKIRREAALEDELMRKIEEEREREREREKDRMSVDKAALEAREKSYSEARERAAVERATTEARKRAMAEARERLEKASMEARLRAERAAVERATSEARQRATEKLMAQTAAYDFHDQVERFPDRFSASSRTVDTRQSYVSSDLHFQSKGISNGLRYSYSLLHEGAEGESPQRCKARLERCKRTAERAANALAEKNRRDLLAQREREERNRVAEALDVEVKRWSSGKEGNLRALLSTLQYILGPDSGWHPLPLTEVITSAAVKKAYRKATLCVHPDKLQQRGATIQQKYICEKVFDLLKEAWNKFNSEER